jgi:hypothetical protein
MPIKRRFDPAKIAPLVRGVKVYRKRFYHFCPSCGTVCYSEDDDKDAVIFCKACLGVDENDARIFCPGGAMVCMTQDEFLGAITPLVESRLEAHAKRRKSKKKE